MKFIVLFHILVKLGCDLCCELLTPHFHPKIIKNLRTSHIGQGNWVQRNIQKTFIAELLLISKIKSNPNIKWEWLSKSKKYIEWLLLGSLNELSQYVLTWMDTFWNQSWVLKANYSRTCTVMTLLIQILKTKAYYIRVVFQNVDEKDAHQLWIVVISEKGRRMKEYSTKGISIILNNLLNCLMCK